MANVPEGFFSALQRAVEQSKQSRMFGSDWQGYLAPGRREVLSKGTGVIPDMRFPLRGEEVDRSGLPGYLSERAGRMVEKDDLFDVLSRRNLPTHTTLRDGAGEPKPDGFREPADTQYRQHSLEGANRAPYGELLTHANSPEHPLISITKDLKEVLSQYPARPEYDDLPHNVRLMLGNPLELGWFATGNGDGARKQMIERTLSEFIPPGGPDVNGFVDRLIHLRKNPAPLSYGAPHFQGLNTDLLSHSRYSQRPMLDRVDLGFLDPTRPMVPSVRFDPGDRVAHVIEEIQSDRHQLAAKNARERRQFLVDDKPVSPLTESDELDRVRYAGRTWPVPPDMPFPNTWHEHEIRKNLREAVMAGTDAFALVGPGYQARRYDKPREYFEKPYGEVYPGYMRRVLDQYAGNGPRAPKEMQDIRTRVGEYGPEHALKAFPIPQQVKDMVRQHGLPLFKRGGRMGTLSPRTERTQ